MPRRLDASHIVALLIGLLACAAMSYWSGPFASLVASPDVRQLVTALHRQTLAHAESDAKERLWRLTLDSERHAFVEHLADSTRKYQSVSRGLAHANVHLLDSLSALARQRGDTAQGAALALVTTQVIAGDSACSVAVSSCQAAQDTLRKQISDRDSLITVRTDQRDSSSALAGRSVSVAQRLNRSLWLTRVAAVGAAVLAVVATVR